VGPLTTAQGNYKYIVVVVEYFPKWIVAKPLINIAAVGLRRFFWQNISHFGVPRKITVDNAINLTIIYSRIFLPSDGGQSSFRINISYSV
jgi:hypothetical protein